MTIDGMADDVAALANYLNLEGADITGYSLGGEVAVQTAIRHPERVGRLIIVSATFRRGGWYPEIIRGMSQMGPAAAEPMKQTPMYQMHASISPRPQDWPVLINKLGDLLRKESGWSNSIALIKPPTLLVFGDADAVRTAHAVEFFELLGGGKRDGGWDASGVSNARLAILPGLTHYAIFSSSSAGSDGGGVF